MPGLRDHRSRRDATDPGREVEDAAPVRGTRRTGLEGMVAKPTDEDAGQVVWERPT